MTVIQHRSICCTSKIQNVLKARFLCWIGTIFYSCLSFAFVCFLGFFIAFLLQVIFRNSMGRQGIGRKDSYLHHTYNSPYFPYETLFHKKINYLNPIYTVSYSPLCSAKESGPRIRND